ncbi:hypothetical protein SETIT_5G096300v2 [Setaria italica]|uniref:Uncharacterized protein n=1 Tax=Setaria italica TaxID=4555 RepID=A0A368R310_SETIT|nr:hypothetical protein SETIT_5G096300v2 [Setaria italica]
MCFRFASCIGVHVRDDDDLYGPTPPRRAADATKTPAPAPRYDDSNADEAGRRTRPSPASPTPAPAVAALAGGHGYAAGAREQQVHACTVSADEALKPPAAARNKVAAHGAGDGARQYRCYEHEQPAREEGNKDCYTTATAASDHERC